MAKDARDIRKVLKAGGSLLFDGGMGTMLQRLGLTAGGCPDELNLTEPETVKKVFTAYKEAGSQVFTTNTFGSTRPKLIEYNLEDKLFEINKRAAEIAREVAGEDLYVAGDIGPTGLFLEPVGEISFNESKDIFTEQIKGLKAGGADVILIETMMDIKEVKAAIIAAKELDMPVFVTMTFDQTLRSVLGSSPESFTAMCDALQVDALGANCSLGIDGILEAIKKMAPYTDIPLMAQANAGLPQLVDNKTVFPDSPSDMVKFVKPLVEAGVRVLGGCCGTTSDHMKAMGEEFKSLKPVINEKRNFGLISSRTEILKIGKGNKPIIIGERINPTGKKALQEEIKNNKTKIIRTFAREQTESGAHALDVNMGVPGIDEAAAMRHAVFTVNENSTIPIVVDSPDLKALEAGLQSVDGKPLINSVSGEEKKLKPVLALAAKYGAAVIALTLNDKGIPETAEERLEIARLIVKEAELAGLNRNDVIIDTLTMTVSAMPEAGLVTLDAVKLIDKELGVPTVLGVSNVSFGLPFRASTNAAFYTMALQSGLSAAIINPNSIEIMDAYSASCLVLNHDLQARNYINRFKDRTSLNAQVAQAGGKTKAKTKKTDDKANLAPIDTLEGKMQLAVVEGDEEHIVGFVEDALNAGWDPIKVSNVGLIPGLEEVGRLFANNTYFLPQVILSADTMKLAFTRLKKELQAKQGKPLGVVVMATVEGDIHDIGKNIVCTLLENHGFEVIDLGKNVKKEKIAQAVREHKAHIVGLSALMTTTVTEMECVIKYLKAEGIKVKTIVGGAVVTEEYSKKIGADAFGGEATVGVELMKAMLRN